MCAENEKLSLRTQTSVFCSLTSGSGGLRGTRREARCHHHVRVPLSVLLSAALIEELSLLGFILKALFHPDSFCNWLGKATGSVLEKLTGICLSYAPREGERATTPGGWDPGHLQWPGEGHLLCAGKVSREESS